MFIRVALISTCCSILQLLSPSLLADTQLTFQDSHPQAGVRSTTVQVKENRVRTGDSTTSVYTLYDKDKGLLYTVNPEVKQYMQTSIASVKEKMAQMMEMQAKMKEQMQQQLNTLPEEQRKTIQQQMDIAEQQAKAPPPEIIVNNTDKQQTIQGLKCSIVTAAVGGKIFKETCIAKEGIDTTDMETLQSMFKFMESMAVESAKIRGIPAPSDKTLPSQHNGVAISTKLMNSGAISELSGVSSDSLDAKLFDIPEGYTLHEPKMPTPAATQTAPK